MSPFSNTLRGAADHLSKSLAVLGEDVLALGFAHLLENHLLGRLRGDSPENVGGLGELDLHVHFGFLAVELLRFLQGDLRGGVGHVLDDLFHGEQIDLAGFMVESGPEVLVRAVILPRRRQDRVLDGGDDHIGLDPLFLGECLDGLLQRVRHSQ